MNSKYLRHVISSLLLLLAFAGHAVALTSANFAKSSKLASGRWIKVGVDRTGVYEISYESLKAMGFSDPRKVALFGMGGLGQPFDFNTSSGKMNYVDDLRAVPVLHRNNKIYFYGIGPEMFEIHYSSRYYDLLAAIQRKSKNIYSDIGYYFITDSQPTNSMTQVNSVGLTSLKEFEVGIGYEYHEVDLYHNTTNTGQLFYGEAMTPENPRLTWDLDLRGAIPGTQCVVNCDIYTDKIQGTSVSYGFEGTDEYTEIPVPAISSTDFAPHSPNTSYFSLPEKCDKFFTDINFNGEDMDASNLDFWTICYHRTAPDLRNTKGERIAQDLIAFPQLGTNKSGKVRIPGGASFLTFDISNPAEPIYIDVKYDGADGIAKLTNTNGIIPVITVFDPMMPQYQVTMVETNAGMIVNQDLHAQASEGADLIIITTPQLLSGAERLADVHRDMLGQRVIVATTDQIYNEYSSGVPDPMAYRGFVKTAYLSKYGCGNVLLLGPLYADFRGISVDKHIGEGLIAYQSFTTNQLRGGFNVNDYYGIMTDYIGSNNLELCNMAVGVGILPVRYDAEIDTYIDKLTDYLTRTDFAYSINHYLLIGGYGDSDLHASQVPEIDTYLNNFGRRNFYSTQLVVDAYGHQEGHDKLFKTIDEGIVLMTYFGHGDPLLLNHDGPFFTASDVYTMRNKRLPFWGVAGCELSEPDKGVRGMGESVVLSTPYGMIGTLIATRETWSSQNLDFFKKFHANFLRNGGQVTSKLFENPVTIGRIYANTKQLSTFSNEMAYQLLCDPAITIPGINREIVIEAGDSGEATAGEWLEVSGYVKNYRLDRPDTNFNGEVVVRLMEPSKVLPCQHVIMSNDPSESVPSYPVDITYADSQLSMGAAEVVEGRFSLKIMVPSAASVFDGKSGVIQLGAYDPSARMGAASNYGVTLHAAEPGTSVLDSDTTPPTVEVFEYDAEANVIRVKVADDVALAFDSDPLRPPFRMRIDNREYTTGSTSTPIIDYDSNSYEKSVHLADLSEGSHTAWITVRDAAGNDTKAEIVFDYLNTLAKYAIALDATAVDGSGDIVAIGETPESADIVILDKNGFLVRRDAFRNGRFTWDAADQNGEAVAPGLYRAYIIETGSHSRKGHSATIDIPVI
ncbi:MAG: hypothetical protein K2L83_08865 [Muribaculaceae bacterium]|nr:hypothetical protein [Muribaculaceae bacterium]